MKSPTLIAATALVAALLAACTGESLPTDAGPSLAAAPKDVTHTSFSIPLNEIVISPCNGETIELSGTFSGQTTELTVNGEVIHGSIHNMVRETGIGLTTGARYVLRDVLYEATNSPTDHSVNVTYSFREANHFITSTPGLSFSGVAAVHYVRTPNGVGQFTRDIFVDAVCR